MLKKHFRFFLIIIGSLIPVSIALLFFWWNHILMPSYLRDLEETRAYLNLSFDRGKKRFDELTETVQKIETVEKLTDQERYDEAEKMLTDQIARSGQSPHFMRSMMELRAGVYLKSGRYDKAVADYTSCLQITDEAVALDDSPYAKEYSDVNFIERIHALAMRSAVYKKLNNRKSAIADLDTIVALLTSEKAISFYRDNNNSRIDSIAMHLRDKGSLLEDDGRFDEAINVFSHAIELKPTDKYLGKLYFRRGLAKIRSGRLSDLNTDWVQAEKLGTTLFVGEYSAGKKDGKCRWFHANGKTRIEGDYKDNIQVGEFTWYYPSGVVKTKGQYAEGKPVGEWKWFFEDGKLKNTKSYV